MLALAPGPGQLDLSFGIINASSAATRAEQEAQRFAVAALPGWEGSTCKPPIALTQRHGWRSARSSRWTRMIDAPPPAARRESSRSVGTGFQAAGFEQLPSSHLYHSVAALTRPPGFRGPNDCSRGAVAHVTDDDRAFVDRFLDMMAAEAGASRPHARGLSQRYRRAAEDVGVRSGRDAAALAKLGGRWSGLARATVSRRRRH